MDKHDNIESTDASLEESTTIKRDEQHSAPSTPSSIIPKQSLERFQFKNTIKAGGSIRIRLARENKFIKEHDSISGTIDVKLTEGLDSSLSKKLILRCKAFERLLKKQENEQFELEKENVFCLDYILIKDFMNEDLEIGQHSYPFTYLLPDRIPTSIFHERNDTQYVICYKLKAFLVTEHDAVTLQPHSPSPPTYTEQKHSHQHHHPNNEEMTQNQHQEKSSKKKSLVVKNADSFHKCKIEKSCIFLVSELYPTLEGIGKSSMHFETSKKFLFSSKKLKISCNFARNVFRMFDDDIVFNLLIDNESSKTVNKIVIELIQSFKHIDSDEKENDSSAIKIFESKTEQVEETVMFQKQFDEPVEPEAKLEKKVIFEIPSYRDMSSEVNVKKTEGSKPINEQYDAFENRKYWLPSVNNSKLIHVSYAIKVTCMVSSFVGPDVVLSCPLYIKPSVTGLHYPKKD
ncbi:hypothetical protein C9374_000965 [Naegleria lovaniensis]|uniref:Arrestin C-terminal-like domain-containing protein n=1 Tax=Naegleria lovaniensis TaxID=51637 RepID=A0AA88GSK6_NAELO|nr:uncharacterized protein C9374_000965 [Naegleria lovaniensis]KAG2388115.1 hypothetical protein C9374_000965 [Naegleria lovaniensis]